MTFLTNLRIKGILPSIRLVLEVKGSKHIPESTRLEFLEKASANEFPLSDKEDKKGS